MKGNTITLAVLVAFAQGVVAEEGVVKDFFVRATKYHRNERGCDPWTKRGETSTQLRLPKSDAVVLDPHRIGNVAVDPQKVPEGSLVLETQTKRFFVATTGGQAVIRRDAAKQLAKRSVQKQKALVFDFYFPREVVETHFTKCWVIPHEGVRFRDLNQASQKERLKPEYWIARLESLYDSSSNEEDKAQLREMMNRLREMK